MKKLAQGFYTAAQDPNPGSLSKESEALPRSHCALPVLCCPLQLVPFQDLSGLPRQSVSGSFPFGRFPGGDS